jgi:asparagine synthase (glutamine-hydrolysing)
MCGIAGFCDFNKKSSKQTLAKMTDVLRSRGPDDFGYGFHETDNVNIGLGHRRLSILDLSERGHQPMVFKGLEIVYNGEVYNFREIRSELKECNYTFDSDGDTEVILKAYHKWGIKSVDKFNGMFAIVIYDRKNDKVVCIRDRAGVKPFYYYHHGNIFMFSSELKSFHQNNQFKKIINKDSLALFLQYGYILQPHTIFKNTFKLKSAHYLEVDLSNNHIEENKYWDVIDFYNKPKLDICEDEAINETEKLLKTAFEYRMVSDVPVGIFLSGGYDSSIVAAILQNQRKEKLKTFTIGFEEKSFDESPFAKQVANYIGTDHTEYFCTSRDAADIIPTLCEIYDEPFGDSSAIPTVLVSRLAKEQVSVSLSADGGDEIFYGYNKYDHCLKYFNRINKIPSHIRNLLKFGMGELNPKFIPYFNGTYNYKTRYEKIKNMLEVSSINESLKYMSQHLTNSEIRKLIKGSIEPLVVNFDNAVCGNNQKDQMLAIDYQTYLSDDILVKVDRATMSVGLEGRDPFLDHNIVEFVSQLPSNIKYKNNDKKWILKKISQRYLPKELMDRPKMGFGVPITEWFKDELKEYFMIYLNEDRLNSEGLFNSREIIILRDEYLNGSNNNVQRLWFLLMFEMWYEKWM